MMNWYNEGEKIPVIHYKAVEVERDRYILKFVSSQLELDFTTKTK